ncbi:hypothetical protein INR49_018549 [Caranx melampygus]|nr:hypothetical protein INR49_018549 [Caranx melampygus]
MSAAEQTSPDRCSVSGRVLRPRRRVSGLGRVPPSSELIIFRQASDLWVNRTHTPGFQGWMLSSLGVGGPGDVTAGGAVVLVHHKYQVQELALGMVIFNHILSRTSRPDSGLAIALTTSVMSLWMELFYVRDNMSHK